MANLAIFFDGTWNTPADRTNVHKLYQLLDTRDGSGQDACYIIGVGTDKGLFASLKNKLSGAFGKGLSDNIREGYRWLAENYQPLDKIYLFGFSRGAYSARSLAGLIRNCGILRPETIDKVEAAYEIYRDRESPDSEEAHQFRADHAYSDETPIEFVGVWDTVGALGVPLDIQGIDVPLFKSYYQFHDTNLSSRVQGAYHALAINEHRSAYAPALWTLKAGEQRALPAEQRWFLGAHSNVGGGYEQDKLCNPSCRWIQDKAVKHGLKFREMWSCVDADYLFPVRDSYAEFVQEHKLAEGIVKRIARSAGEALNETIDPIVKKRLAEDAKLLKDFPALQAALLALRTD